MFDIWRRIDEEGTVAVPTCSAALSALGWVEVGEKHPELLPEGYRQYDVFSDRQLIWESPFVVVSDEGMRSYHFKMTDPVSGKCIDAWIDPLELAAAFGCDYYHADDGDSAFGGILVCSCGIAGCAGIWSQTFHVSEKMVHWSVVYNNDELEFFFEREAYEKGVLTMMRALLEKRDEFTLPGPDDSLSGDVLKAFELAVGEMLERRSCFRDVWEALGCCAICKSDEQWQFGNTTSLAGQGERIGSMSFARTPRRIIRLG